MKRLIVVISAVLYCGFALADNNQSTHDELRAIADSDKAITKNLHAMQAIYKEAGNPGVQKAIEGCYKKYKHPEVIDCVLLDNIGYLFELADADEKNRTVNPFFKFQNVLDRFVKAGFAKNPQEAELLLIGASVNITNVISTIENKRK